jgi:hypothetical protein
MYNVAAPWKRSIESWIRSLGLYIECNWFSPLFWIPIAIYFETHLPNTERSDEIDSTDGGSDTDTENAELTTHSSNTRGETVWHDASFGYSVILRFVLTHV